MSQGREKFDLDLVERERERAIAEKMSLIPFGPCRITRQAWKSLKLSVKAHSSHPNPKEVPFVLLGKPAKDKFIITEAVQLVTKDSGLGQCTYSFEDIKKIGEEAKRDGLLLVGFLHTHPGDSVEPSVQDRVSWLSLMFEFNRPIIYFILSSSLKLGAYSVSVKTFMQLKDAIKFLPVELKD